MVQQGENDEVWVAPNLHRTHFDNVIEIQPAAYCAQAPVHRSGIRVARVGSWERARDEPTGRLA
jgi:hypothetical protein